MEWVSADLPSDNSFNSISFQESPVISNQKAKWQYHGPFFATSSAGNIRGMSSAAFFTYEAGEQPHLRVRLGTPNGFFSSVTIGGYLIDAVN